MKRVGLILLGACLLQACQTRTNLAPVYSANQESQLQEIKMVQDTPTQAVKNEHELQAQTTYEVLPGENLYIIAKRFGMDYHDLARINGIEKPYYIHAGQVLLISRYEHLEPTVADAPKKQEFEFRAGNSAPAPEPVAVPQAVQPVTLQPPLPMATASDWIWPVRQGYIAEPFSAQNKGMDIGVIKPQQVVAVSLGSVVYAGVNLTGDDDLVIVKHADGVLSAYSAKMDVVVHEGETVKIGQKLALIRPGKENVLHFDLRKQGKSVDPIEYVTLKT